MHRSVVMMAALAGAVVALAGCEQKSGEGKGGLSPQAVADMLHEVMSADRTVYTKNVINRLTLKDKVITASEHFDEDKALPLPAQMFRFGAEMTADKTDKFSYALLSLWPVNQQNRPRTDLERQGLQKVADKKDENFYGEETLGDKKYFTAIYADIAVAEACTACHNDHKDSPRRDFKLGDVMGGVVIRLPLAD